MRFLNVYTRCYLTDKTTFLVTLFGVDIVTGSLKIVFKPGLSSSHAGLRTPLKMRGLEPWFPREPIAYWGLHTHAI